jgi:hypothetical protein
VAPRPAISVDFAYDARLQLTHFELVSPSSGDVYKSDYQYYDDGRPRFIADRRAWPIQPGWPSTENMHQFDRAYNYDQAGRLTQALTGAEARGGTTADGPYKETYQYDAWHHLMNRVNRIWSKPLDSFETTYINNRNDLPGATYDADGNPTNEASFDASGRKSSYNTSRFYVPTGSFNPNPSWNPAVDANTYDGDGQLVKQLEAIGTDHFDSYWIRSTVLGGAVILWTEVATNSYYAPGWSNTLRLASIYAAGEKIAHSTDGNVVFDHAEPLTGRRNGIEADPLGQEVGGSDPGPDNPLEVGQYPEPHEFGNADDPSRGCTIDGITSSCNEAMMWLNSGVAALAPTNSNRAVADPNNPGQRTLARNLPVFGESILGRYWEWVDDSGDKPKGQPEDDLGSDVIRVNGWIPRGHWGEVFDFSGQQNPWRSLRFSDLWKNHPGNMPNNPNLIGARNEAERMCPCKESDGVTCSYGNECAVRLSVSLQRSGIDMSSFTGEKCSTSGYAVRGLELATWMSDPNRLGKPQVFENGAEALRQIAGVTGIVYVRQFAGVSQPNQRWDHIDVWNGTRLGHGLTQFITNSPSYVWFWPIK